MKQTNVTNKTKFCNIISVTKFSSNFLGRFYIENNRQTKYQKYICKWDIINVI